jgi:oligopeptide/dipeptide ABC transporter ATP-binding protein
VSATLLQVTQLGIALRGQEVVTDASLELQAGQCVGMVGESGSGKSVTCRAITGMLPRIGGTVTSGSILLEGRELAGLDPSEWRALRGRRIGLVPQASLAGLDPVMRVGSQLAETVRRWDRKADRRRRSLALLEQVRMPDPERVLKSYPHQLSGGMRQRAMIALALAPQPTLLLADEPTTALDVTVQQAIIEMLDEVRRETGMGLVIVSHDLSMMRSITRRVYVMYGGVTVETGPTDEVLSHPRHPYTQALLGAAPDTVPRGVRLIGVPGQPPAPDEWRDDCRFATRCDHATDRCLDGRPALEMADEWSSVACARWTEINAHV